MIWAYYDESGEYDKSGNLLNMTIGGCMSTADRWLSAPPLPKSFRKARSVLPLETASIQRSMLPLRPWPT
jgi:hypothetical protein